MTGCIHHKIIDAGENRTEVLKSTSTIEPFSSQRLTTSPFGTTVLSQQIKKRDEKTTCY